MFLTIGLHIRFYQCPIPESIKERWRIYKPDGSMARGQRQGSVGPQGCVGDISCCSSPASRQLGSAIPAGPFALAAVTKVTACQRSPTAPLRAGGKGGGERAGSQMHHQFWWVCQYCLDPGGAEPAVTHAGPLQRANTHTLPHTPS